MKKVRILFLLVLSIVAVLAFASCSCDNESGCEHEWDEGSVQKAATCLEKGEKLYTCEDCGETKIEKYEGTHSYAKVNQTTATCTVDGSTTYECSVCKDSYTDITSRAQGHSTAGCTWTTTEQANGSCNMLHVESTNCKTCNEKVEHIYFYEKHDMSVSITTAATCKTEGVKTYECNNCDYSETETFTDAKAHTYGEGVVNASVTTYTCSGCSATKKVVSALDSTEATVPSDALQSAGGVELESATIEFDKSTLEQLNGKDVTISAGVVYDSVESIAPGLSADEREKLENTTIYDFTISDGNNSYISQFNGKLTITLPYTLSQGQDPNAIAVWYIKEDGKPETISATYTEINGAGYAVFETDHFSYYSVIRMSVEERCAAFGHTFNSTVEPASCNKEGYTIDVCKYCKYVAPRYNFTKALTHNYVSKVVAPTCNEMGYTENTCGNCNDSYKNSFKAKLAHNYASEVIASTCTTMGYTYHKCTNAGCTVSYTDSELSALPHYYEDGKCTMCGKAEDAASNTLLTAINSLANADSFSVTLDGFKVSTTVNGMKYTMTYKNVAADLKITADNYLEGTGTAIVTTELEENGEIESYTTSGKVVFANKKLYTYYAIDGDNIIADYDYNYNDGIGGGIYIGEGGPVYESNNSNGTLSSPPTEVINDMTIVIPQDFIFNAMNEEFEDEFGGIEQELIDNVSSKLLSVWNSMLTLKNSPVEATLARLIEFVFTKTQSNGTNVYTFNPTFAKTLFNDLKAMKLNKVVDYVFGANTYDSLLKFAKELPSLTLTQLKPKVEAEFGKYGVNASFIYKSISELFEMDVEKMFNELEFKDMTLLELYNEMFGKMTAADFNEMINTYDKMAKETTILSLVADVFKADTEEIDAIVKEISDTIDSVIASLGKVSIKFTTTADGMFLSSEMKLDNFTYEINEQGQNVKVSANGTMTFKINNKVEVPTQNELFDSESVISGAIRPNKTVVADEFSIIVNSGKTYVIKHSEVDNLALMKEYLISYGSTFTENVTYNGTSCTKVTSFPVNNLYIIDNNTMAYSAESCTGWYLINFNTTSYHNYYYEDMENSIYATLWVDKDGKIQGMEITSNLTDENSYLSSFSFYYSPATKKYSSDPSHNFYLSKTIPAKGCEYGKYVYKCKSCGIEYDSEFGRGHAWQETATLTKGASSCEDGVTITSTCTDCGAKGSSRTAYYHYNIKQKIKIDGTTECGDTYIVYYECACKDSSYISGTLSDHAIYDYDYEDGWRIYTCASCGFSYKFKSVDEYKYYPNREETCWRTETDTIIIGGKTYSFVDKSWASHDTVYSEDSEGYHVYTCRLCGEITSKYKYEYDEYGREIYYHNVVDNYGWTRTFNGCYYIRTYFDGEVETGYDHVEFSKVITKRSCSQYGVYLWCCELCNSVLGEYSYERPYYWYGYNNHYWNAVYSDGYWGDFLYYECSECGTRSSYGSEGKITLEDMTDEGSFKVGFNNNNVYDMTSEIDINIIFNIDADGNGIELENSEYYFTIKDTTAHDYYNYYGENSGIITVDLSMLYNAIAQQNQTGTMVETVSLVVWVLTESQTQTNDDGSPVMFWMAHALTFTLEELEQIGR